VREIQTSNREHGTHDDELSVLESKVEELGTALADTRFDLFKRESRCEQLELQLTTTLEELANRPVKSASPEQTPSEEVGVASPDTNPTDAVTNEEVCWVVISSMLFESVHFSFRLRGYERKWPSCKLWLILGNLILMI